MLFNLSENFGLMFDYIFSYIWCRKNKLDLLNSVEERDGLPESKAAKGNEIKELSTTRMEKTSDIKPNINTLQDKRIPFACVVTQLMSQNNNQPVSQR